MAKINEIKGVNLAMRPLNIKSFTPAQVGWKRRTDMERHSTVAKGTVWELPDGRLYIAPPGPVYIQVLYGED